MKTREMYAPKGWEDEGVSNWCHGMRTFSTDRRQWQSPVRVLVQEIPEGMPEFRPGDRVRCGELVADVTGAPFCHDSHWRVPVCKLGGAGYACWSVNMVRKVPVIPPETSRLIRVTGPEDAVEKEVGRILHNVTPWSTVPNPDGVRVEVVDE